MKKLIEKSEKAGKYRLLNLNKGVKDKMLTDTEKNVIVDYLTQKVNPDLIYVFGSYSKNRERKNSDIDIAYLKKKKIDEYKLFLLAQELADKLNQEVDLIDIKRVSTVFKTQIIQGNLIYNRDNYKKMEFELKVLRDYANLNQERKVILDRVWG